MNKRIIIGTAAGVGLLLFAFIGGRMTGSGAASDTHDTAAAAAEATTWTCSMHPQVKQPNPGKCPICFMDLIPLETGDESMNEREIKLSPTAMKLAQIETMPAVREYVTKSLRLVGKVEYDETRLSTITAWVPGRLDRLYVDYTGITVKKNDHMVYLYSPEILTAQQELLGAISSNTSMAQSEQANMRAAGLATIEAVREKLRLWGLSDEQIKTIETRGVAEDHIQINAPIGGIVINKQATEGMYVKTGTPIYQIADLTQVWVKLDAYESDLPWLRYGQQVTFTSESYPGESFTGKIAFIDPILTSASRTVKVRVNVDNKDGKLKPGMFVRAVAEVHLADGENVLNEDLAGKWISPMHPEVIKDGPGSCDVCGMPLVKAETLGFVTPDSEDHRPPLVIPATAPLLTGTRAVVYVQHPKDAYRFEGREVVLGARAGNSYVVKSGLEEGERVVVNGNFKLDSALQILAKPSMMSTDPDFDVPAAFTHKLEPLFADYFIIQSALSNDDPAQAQSAASDLLKSLAAVTPDNLDDQAEATWRKLHATLAESTRKIAASKELDPSRDAFHLLSTALTTVAKRFGTGMSDPVHQFHCPMAFDNKGANWLQGTDDIVNPYFGSSMLKCGSLVKKLGVSSESSVVSEKTLEGEAPDEPGGQRLTSEFDAQFKLYLNIQKALSQDNLENAQSSAAEFFGDLGEIHYTGSDWKKLQAELAASAKIIARAENIEAARQAFAPLSESMTAAVTKYRKDLTSPVFKVECSMAFSNRGASWLQDHDKVENPYFGSTMFSCGSVIETIKQ